jgi:hypothetical protein
MTATEYDVRTLVGDVDPLIVERIVELGATTDEIEEAMAALADERPPQRQQSPRVLEVRALLAEVIDEQLDDLA